MQNYSGDFKPALELSDFDHDLLATFGREIMLANHIHDRSGLLPVVMAFGQQAQTDVACDEWMSSSPIYNWRNRVYLKMEGDDVSVALKGLQLDIGAPHNFLNFHYELKSPDEGYFWTSTCGPYNYVRAVSNADTVMETQICHHMEDPTFDATVMAVNPLMRCTAVFRPPYTNTEVPEGGPCKWLVSIQRDIGLVEDCPNLAKVKETLAAQFEFDALPAQDVGMNDYSGAFKRDFELSDFSHNTLTVQCKEMMLHVLLLNYACYTSIAERFGEDKIVPMQQEQWRHLAPITVSRLRKTFGIEGADMAAILKVMQLNPFLPWEYLRLGFEQVSDTRGLVWLRECAAMHEPVQRGIASLLVTHPEQPGFDALAHAVNPQARMRQVDVSAVPVSPDAIVAWEIVIDPDAEPVQPSEFADVVGAADINDLDNTRHVYNYDFYDRQVSG